MLPTKASLLVLTASCFATVETIVTGGKEEASILRIRDTAGGKELLAVKLPIWSYLAGDKMWNSDGTRLAVICNRNSDPPDPEIKIWDTNTGKELVSIKGLTNWIHDVAFSPDGRYLSCCIAGSDEPRAQPERVRVWDAATGTEMLSLSGFRHVAFSPDGEHLAAAASFVGTKPFRTEMKMWNIITRRNYLSSNRSSVR